MGRVAFWREMADSDTDQDVSILLKLPEDTRELLMRLPRESEWAFVKSCANKRLGEGKWIASLLGERWFNHERGPKHGEIVRLH
jgi:hypothetical protein